MTEFLNAKNAKAQKGSSVLVNLFFAFLATFAFKPTFLSMRKLLFIYLLPCLAFAQQPASFPFRDVTKEAGINHQFRVYEGMFGGGACVLDFDNDGFEDVFITGGMNPDVLYRNTGKGRFTNVYDQSGLTDSRTFVTQGVTAADVNRDGWVDLFVTTITTKNKNSGSGRPPIPRAMNLLFLNNGPNRGGKPQFRNATKEYGLDQLASFSTGASFGDIDADGFPDLYVGNYFNDFRGELTFINDATIVGATQTSPGYLLRNKDGKSFEDVYEEYGLTHKGFGFGGVFSDFDNDGDQDLFINHDFGYKRTPNLLLESQYPRQQFRDIAKPLGMDLKINSMGTAIGDINNDGLLDYYFTNIRFNRMMVSTGAGKPFVDKLTPLGMNYVAISWGANFVDFDHDGDLDLFVANGDLNPNCVPMANYFFENLGGRFEEKAYFWGLNDYGLGRGSVVFDYDNDGDMDLLVVNQIPTLTYPVESITRLYRNDAAKGNWLKVALRGVQAEMRGIGARVVVVAGGKRHIREVDGGASSHLSQNSTILHVGLGTVGKVDSILVSWPGDKQQLLTNQPVNQLLTITETPDKPTNPLLWVSIGIVFLLLILAGFVAYRRYQAQKPAVSQV